MPEPFIIRATGPGEADVVDRATGERVGWLRANFWGQWEASTGAPRIEMLPGSYRYRTDAARHVWEASR